MEKLTVDQLLSQLQTEPPSQEQPFSLLFKAFEKLFLEESVQRASLTLGRWPFPATVRPLLPPHNSESIGCAIAENWNHDCECDRYYSQPDCDIGWDSHRGCFYHGYDLYLLTASDSVNDLPLFPLLNPASRHDSLGFLQCFFTMKSFFTRPPDFQAPSGLRSRRYAALRVLP